MGSVEDQEELEALSRAVRTFARFEIQVLTRSVIHQLQRLPASGIFSARGLKTLWDEFCYDSQKGPFDDQIARAWKDTIDSFLTKVSGRVPGHIAPLLLNYAAWELDEAVAGGGTENIKEVLREQLAAYANNRSLGWLLE